MRTPAAGLVLVLGVLLLTGCSIVTGDDSKAREIEAQRQLEETKSEIRIRESEIAHRQTMETLPTILIIVAGIVATAAAAAVIVWQVRQPPKPAPIAYYQPTTQAPALPAPTVNVFVLPSGDGGRRVDQWRQLAAEAERRGLASGGQVTIYDDRRQ